MNIHNILNEIHQLLSPDDYEDFCPNGLQLSGKTEIQTIVGGVTASVELIDLAISHKADAILVHHGLIWYGQQPTFTGGYGKRLALLLKNDINLLAYHLPLDGDLTYGNAARMAVALNLKNIIGAFPYKGQTIGVTGECADINIEEFSSRVEAVTDREPLVFAYGPRDVSKVAIATGAAPKEIYTAIAQDADVFITGEAREETLHIAKEEEINFVAAGHHATERFGVKALGEKLVQELSINFQFIDVDNPV
jgi:dinuclear metal center YbgI/SA1388 family protein